MNPSILHFSRAGSVVKALFFLGFAVLAFAFTVVLFDEGDAPPRTYAPPGGLDLPMPTPQRDPLTPLKLPFLFVAGGVCLFYTGRHAARAVTRKVAVKIENAYLHFHPSYRSAPAMLPVQNVVEAIFDRADRLPGDGTSAGKLGAKLRHGLYLRYHADGEAGELLLIDNDIGGGAEQLSRFAAHLDAWRRPAAYTAADYREGAPYPPNIA